MKTIPMSAIVALSLCLSLHASAVSSPIEPKTVISQLPAMEKSVENVHEAMKSLSKPGIRYKALLAQSKVRLAHSVAKAYAVCKQRPYIPFITGLGLGLASMYWYMKRSVRTNVPSVPKAVPKAAKSKGRVNLMAGIRTHKLNTTAKKKKRRKIVIKPNRAARSVNPLMAELMKRLPKRASDSESD